MAIRFGTVLTRALMILLLAAVPVLALASGEIGEHVEDLKGHLGEYENEVNTFNDRVAGMVNVYADEGSGAVDTDELIELWEEVKLHAAVEVTHVPTYAAIWQGIYGVKEAIENDAGVETARTQQQALAQALWEGLGAVRLAAKQQAEGGMEQKTGKASGSSTVDEIITNLEKVTVEHAEGETQEATELVHDTYMNLFEGIEGALIEQDAELVEALEKDFNVTLPQLIKEGAAVSRVTAQVDAMKKKLARAQKLLKQAEQDQSDVF